jgi:hypothetical protein
MHHEFDDQLNSELPQTELPQLVKLSPDALEMMRLVEDLANDNLNEAGWERLNVLLRSSEEVRQLYLNYIDQHIHLKRLLFGVEPYMSLEPTADERKQSEHVVTICLRPRPSFLGAEWRIWAIGSVMASCLALVMLYWGDLSGRLFSSHPALSQDHIATESPKNPLADDDEEILLKSVTSHPLSSAQNELEHPSLQESTNAILITTNAEAKFYGIKTPDPGSMMPIDREVSLISGMVELNFPSGAKTILQGPAVFTVKSPSEILILYGDCSVYCTAQTSGFKVTTPALSIVDLGTRFFVHVDDTGEVELHVNEGKAEVRRHATGSEKQSENTWILKSGEAVSIDHQEPMRPVPVTFNSNHYIASLPDRLVQFDGSRDDEGAIADLENVIVVRGSHLYKYHVDELIGADVMTFKCTLNVGSRIRACLPEKQKLDIQALTIHDKSLLTGIVNIGGSKKALQHSPILPGPGIKDEDVSDGISIRFHQPVKNEPGPDMVFFDLHRYPDPIEGDGFFIGPVDLKPGLKFIKIIKYDIPSYSPFNYRLQKVLLYRSDTNKILNLEQLATMKLTPYVPIVKYRLVATSIDFSQMGYAPGEEVRELFLYDTDDNPDQVDPVFIGGLPARKLTPSNDKLKSQPIHTSENQTSNSF